MITKQSVQIPYNLSYKTGMELEYIKELVQYGPISGNHKYTALCSELFNQNFGYESCFFTTSCSKALEMTAQLCELSELDEVIVPSFSYVTDASAFVKTGAKVVFADSCKDSPHMSPSSVSNLITPRTKVLVIVHYAGIPCDMDAILKIVKAHDLILVEDCAQAIGVKYNNRYLGTFGDFSTFSFHETKNIHCGEGGLLVINNEKYITAARQIWQEGTDKYLFERGEKSTYEWTQLGSSYQPSEISMAFLYAQLLENESITKRRKELWLNYFQLHTLKQSHNIVFPNVQNDDYNGHIFYLGLPSKKQREELILFLKENGVEASFHYLPLHKSPYWLENNVEITLHHAEYWGDCIIRLPLFVELQESDQQLIIALVFRFFEEETKNNF